MPVIKPKILRYAKKITYFALVFVYGCNFYNQSNTTPNSISTPGKSVDPCLSKPSLGLESKNVKSVALGNQTVIESGQVSGNKNIGYTFDAQKGDQLKFSTKDNICISVYAPNLTLLTGANLPEDGKYTIQVSAAQGVTTFNLEMSLNSVPVPPTPISSPQGSDSYFLATENSSSASSTPKSNPVSSTELNSSSDQDSDLTENQVVQIIQGWLDSKSQVFAPPFSREVAAKYITGPYYDDVAKPSGSIDWLQSHGAYYKYNASRVKQSWNFLSSGRYPSIKVRIYEDSYLYNSSGNIEPTNSGSSTADYIYIFHKEDDGWKIHSRKKEKMVSR